MIHKRSTAPERSVKISHGRAQTGPTAPTPPPTQAGIKTQRCFSSIKDPQTTTISQNTQTKTQKGDKAKTRTQQQTKPNTGAKEIQQANPGRPDKQPKHQAATTSSTDKSPIQSLHRAWSPTHRATKEESKATNRDRQASSPLQYINATANPENLQHWHFQILLLLWESFEGLIFLVKHLLDSHEMTSLILHESQETHFKFVICCSYLIGTQRVNLQQTPISNFDAFKNNKWGMILHEKCLWTVHRRFS